MNCWKGWASNPQPHVLNPHRTSADGNGGAFLFLNESFRESFSFIFLFFFLTEQQTRFWDGAITVGGQGGEEAGEVADE